VSFGSHGRLWRSALAAAGVAMIALAGCATPPTDDPEALAAYREANDPLEPFNRGVFSFNRTVDGLVLKPAAQIYRGVVPETGRNMVHNFLENWTAPVVVANSLLQGDMDRATIALGRFFINTMAGLLGTIDVARELGGEGHRDEDFGQTLAVWGVGEGPYLVLPILGPSNPRDAVGLAVDSVLDPWSEVFLDTPKELARSGVTAVDTRSRYIDQIDELEATSVDFYAAIRSLYRQRRVAEIRNGDPDIGAFPEIPDYESSAEP
jgi:phospholipid-binding lipoprotein MlaA